MKRLINLFTLLAVVTVGYTQSIDAAALKAKVAAATAGHRTSVTDSELQAALARRQSRIATGTVASAGSTSATATTTGKPLPLAARTSTIKAVIPGTPRPPSTPAPATATRPTPPPPLNLDAPATSTSATAAAPQATTPRPPATPRLSANKKDAEAGKKSGEQTKSGLAISAARTSTSSNSSSAAAADTVATPKTRHSRTNSIVTAETLAKITASASLTVIPTWEQENNKLKLDMVNFTTGKTVTHLEIVYSDAKQEGSIESFDGDVTHEETLLAAGFKYLSNLKKKDITILYHIEMKNCKGNGSEYMKHINTGVELGGKKIMTLDGRHLNIAQEMYIEFNIIYEAPAQVYAAPTAAASAPARPAAAAAVATAPKPVVATLPKKGFNITQDMLNKWPVSENNQTSCKIEAGKLNLAITDKATSKELAHMVISYFDQDNNGYVLSFTGDQKYEIELLGFGLKKLREKGKNFTITNVVVHEGSYNATIIKYQKLGGHSKMTASACTTMEFNVQG